MSKIFKDELETSPNNNGMGVNAVFKTTGGVGREGAKL